MHVGLGDTQESAVSRHKPSEKFQIGSSFQEDWLKARGFVIHLLKHVHSGPRQDLIKDLLLSSFS